MTHLSVNLNKVALLRNQRETPYPDLIDTAGRVLASGAHGITVHPRPDERHIRKSDIPALSEFLSTYNAPFPPFMMRAEQQGDIEFNIEGYPDPEFITLVTKNKCDQVTLVPDDPAQKTSDHGWDIPSRREYLKEIIKELKDAGRRVSLFIDPIPSMADAAAEIGADRIELYTGPYALDTKLLPDYVATAEAANKSAIGINAGHDLNLDNLAKFIAGIPTCAEVSIGHAITSDALNMGWPAAVNAYLAAIHYGQRSAKAA